MEFELAKSKVNCEALFLESTLEQLKGNCRTLCTTLTQFKAYTPQWTSQLRGQYFVCMPHLQWAQLWIEAADERRRSEYFWIPHLRYRLVNALMHSYDSSKESMQSYARQYVTSQISLTLDENEDDGVANYQRVAGRLKHNTNFDNDKRLQQGWSVLDFEWTATNAQRLRFIVEMQSDFMKKHERLDHQLAHEKNILITERAWLKEQVANWNTDFVDSKQFSSSEHYIPTAYLNALHENIFITLDNKVRILEWWSGKLTHQKRDNGFRLHLSQNMHFRRLSPAAICFLDRNYVDLPKSCRKDLGDSRNKNTRCVQRTPLRNIQLHSFMSYQCRLLQPVSPAATVSATSIPASTIGEVHYAPAAKPRSTPKQR